LGNVYRSQGDYAHAADHYIQALKIFENLGDKKNIALCLNNLGNVYRSQGDYAHAADHYLKSYQISESIGDPKGIALGLGNLANIYYHQGNYALAADHYLKSLKIKQEAGDKKGIAAIFNNLANVYDVQGEYVRATDYYFKSLKIFEELGDKDGIAIVWGGLSDLYLKTGQVGQAREFARKGLALAQEIGNAESIRNNALSLANADSAAGDFAASLKHYKLFHAYSDSVRNDEQTKKIAALQSRYQFEKELAEKKRQEEAMAAIEAEKRERTYMFQSLGIFAFIVTMVLSLFLLGRMNMPRWMVKGLLYTTLIMTFEFAVMLFDPLNERYSQGLPIYKMLFNTAIALCLGPLHNLAERKLTARLVKSTWADTTITKHTFKDRE
jgi:tetratricopeptide (TPR) repeat protein